MTEHPLEKRFVPVLGRRIAYHERGVGAPILFLHGNPTSSYIWRNVLPALNGLGWLIAPDLIGMGDSDKLPDATPASYRLAAHREHLWAFIEAVVGPDEKVLIVGHDWGGVLGFDWANHHRERVRAIAYMKTIVRPITHGDGSSRLRPVLMGLRSDQGERLIAERNLFVEEVLQDLTQRSLSPAEMAEYRRPFLEPGDRWPTLAWPREIPIAGSPADVAALVEDYSRWLSRAQLPKLFINAEPGVVLGGELREFCRGWPNQTEVTVPGLHYLQEDSGPEIGAAIALWIDYAHI